MDTECKIEWTDDRGGHTGPGPGRRNEMAWPCPD